MRRPLIAALVVVLLVARNSGHAPGRDFTFLPIVVPAQTETVASGMNNFPDATRTQVFGINNAGPLVGEFVASGADEGFLYSGGGFMTTDLPGAAGTTRRGINHAGEIVGTYGTTVEHGFGLSGGVLSTIDVRGTAAAYLNGSHTQGDVLGTYRRVTAGPSTDFLPGFANTGLFGINDPGAMVGQTLPQGVIASTVPEPSTGILAGTVVLGTGFLYWWHSRRR